VKTGDRTTFSNFEERSRKNVVCPRFFESDAAPRQVDQARARSRSCSARAARAAWASPICVLADFEPQILEYLKTKHGVSGFSGVPDLLRSIVKQSEGEKHGGQLALLADLARSLDSFNELPPRALAAYSSCRTARATRSGARW